MDLVHGVSVASQKPGQADPVGPGALDTEGHQLALRTDAGQAKGEQLSKAGEGGRDEQLGESAAEPVEQDSDVLVLVGVDTDDDIVAA